MIDREGFRGVLFPTTGVIWHLSGRHMYATIASVPQATTTRCRQEDRAWTSIGVRLSPCQIKGVLLITKYLCGVDLL